MAPQTPQRSSRPGQAVARLGIPGSTSAILPAVLEEPRLLDDDGAVEEGSPWRLDDRIRCREWMGGARPSARSPVRRARGRARRRRLVRGRELRRVEGGPGVLGARPVRARWRRRLSRGDLRVPANAGPLLRLHRAGAVDAHAPGGHGGVALASRRGPGGAAAATRRRRGADSGVQRRLRLAAGLGNGGQGRGRVSGVGAQDLLQRLSVGRPADHERRVRRPAGRARPFCISRYRCGTLA